MKALSLQAGRIRLLVASLAMVAAATTSHVAAAQAPVVALAAAETGHELFKAEAHALYRSVDEGRHWQATALPKATSRKAITTIAVAARGDQLLYIAGPNLGVWRSRDGGRTWTAKNAGLPSTNVVTLTTHADQPRTVYVDVSKKGIYRSEDAGDHWRLMDAGPREPIVRFVHSNMPGSMQTGWLFAATAKGVSRSMDCFCGWRDAGVLKTDVTAVAYDPSDTKRVYAITDKGLSVTDNGGELWSPVTSPAADVAALVVGETGIVYAADGQGTLYRSSDHGRSWLRADD